MRANFLYFLKPFGLLLLLCVTYVITTAQTGTVEGSVKATNSSIPPGARVVLIDPVSGLTREPDSIDTVTGKFEIKNVQEGRYQIVACAGKAYNPTQLNIEVKEAKTRSAGLTLSLARARTVIKGKLKTPNIDVSALAFGCEVDNTKTDARGRFRFESLPVPPQKYAVQANPAGANAMYSNLFQVTAGGETEVALTFKEEHSGSTLVAQVVYPSRCDRKQGDQTDLTGTYTGKLGYIGGGRNIDATLAISGNEFTLTSASEKRAGQITAVTTCGYTAVTMMFRDQGTSNTSAPLPTVSLQAVRVGNSVRFLPASGAKASFVFSTTEAAKLPEKKARTRMQ